MNSPSLLYFTLVLIGLFSLGVTAEALRANIGWKSAISLQRGPVDSKFQVEGVAPTNHSSSQKTWLNDLSYGINIWTDLSSVLSQSTRLTDKQTDRRTDGRTDSFLLTRPLCIQCSAVKTVRDGMYKLVLFTNRKSHTGFRLVQTSVTLNDSERVTTDDERYLCGSRASCM